MNASLFPPIAAIIHTDEGIADDVLTIFAHDLRTRGWRVRGLLQQVPEAAGAWPPLGNQCSLKQARLIDLDDSRRSFPLFQDLGSGSISCRVDAAGVAEASVVLRRALVEGADLVVTNRFGALEAAGGGLAAEMLALMSEGVPLLTTVEGKYLAHWLNFTGGAAVELSPRLDVLDAWFAGLEHFLYPEPAYGMQ